MASMPLLTSCPEEDLLLPIDEGGGYLSPRLGDSLGDGRYNIVRKLGVGQYSSIWLVRDTQVDPEARKFSTYRAAKVLTVAATQLHLDGTIPELEVWQKLMGGPPGTDLPQLYDHFVHKGREGPHLCLITNLASINLSMFRKTFPDGRIPPWILKPLLGCVSKSLDEMHAAGVIHTDVKPTNIVIGTKTDTDTVDKFLAMNPVEVYGEVALPDGQRCLAWVSQPLPYDIPHDITPTKAELLISYLIDFGQAQWIGKPPTEETCMSYALRAPELVLEVGLGQEVDIWAFGCLVFEMLTGEWLFNPKADDGISAESDHLAQMISLFGDVFPQTFLDESPVRDQFFDEKGNLIQSPPSKMNNIEDRLRACPALRVKPNDIEQVTSFLRECLQLDPAQRPKAYELGRHPWMWDAYMGGATYGPHMIGHTPSS